MINNEDSKKIYCKKIVMGEYIKKCQKCGGKYFDINEFVVYGASLSDEGKLTTYKIKNNGVEMIICSECHEEYSMDDFKQVIFEE